jgi:putative addiction module CopG family antidote
MNVSLKPNVEAFVADRIKAGQYNDVSDVVNDAIEMLMEQEHASAEYDTYLRTELQRGVDQLDRGERATFTAETIIAEGRKRLQQQRPGDE